MMHGTTNIKPMYVDSLNV